MIDDAQGNVPPSRYFHVMAPLEDSVVIWGGKVSPQLFTLWELAGGANGGVLDVERHGTNL